MTMDEMAAHPKVLNHRWLYWVLALLGVLIIGVVVTSFLVGDGGTPANENQPPTLTAPAF